MSARACVSTLLLFGLAFAGRPAGGEDARSKEILRMDCHSAVGQRDVTLYANGMVRVRRGPEARDGIELLQLDAKAFDGVKHRLAKEDLSESDAQRIEAGGLDVETCTVRLWLKEDSETTFTFQPFDALSLAQSHVVAIVQELAQLAESTPQVHGLPSEYMPRPGDVLRRINGALYQVIGMTSDGKGVELEGVDQPFELYVALKDLRQEFVDVVHREGQ